MMKHILAGLFFCFSFLSGYAQLITPLDSYPKPVASNRYQHARISAVGDTLNLPFFEDFSGQFNGAPNLFNWQPGGGVFVNNQFGVNSPSFGVATLEGIRSNGFSYNNFTAYGYNDTLTSKALNLKNYNPVADSLYLSFYWQAGGLAGSPDANSPSRPVFLALEFKEPGGVWREVWRQVGENQFTAFKRVDVAITDPVFFYKGFQFRFRNSGEQKGTGDAWNLDYIYLNKKINTTKTLLEDVTVSNNLNSLLNRYTAMPAWQFLANAAAELNDSIYTTINNQNNRFAPITWRGYNQITNVTQPADTFLRGNAAIEPLAAQFQILSKPELNSSTALGNDFSVKSSIFLNSRETFAPTRENDTISRLTEFKDYFAYDDGTAETNFSLDKSGQRQGAYSFDLNVPDFVKGIRVYLTKTNVAGHLISFRVWDAGEQGNPASTIKAQQGFIIPKVDTLNNFFDVVFPAAVPVEGSFFIGWSLSTNVPDFVNIGFDLNENAPGKIKYNNGTGGWTTFTGQRGALLMRPIMARVTGAKDIIQDQSAVNAFPNPSTGKVNLDGAVINWVVTDVTGKVFQKGVGNRTNQNELDLSFVSNGLYFIHCYTKKGIIIKKISINH